MYVEAVRDSVFVHGVLCGFAERVSGCLGVYSVHVMGVIKCHVVCSTGYLRIFRYGKVRSEY